MRVRFAAVTTALLAVAAGGTGCDSPTACNDPRQVTIVSDTDAGIENVKRQRSRVDQLQSSGWDCSVTGRRTGANGWTTAAVWSCSKC